MWFNMTATSHMWLFKFKFKIVKIKDARVAPSVKCVTLDLSIVSSINRLICGICTQ